MTRKSLLTIFIFFLAGASFWFFSLKKDIKETQNLLSEQSSAPARIVTREVERVPSNVNASVANNSSTKSQVNQELQTLQQRLVEEQERLNSQNQMVESLKVRQAQEQPANYTSQIQERTQQIDILVTGLRDYRRAEDDLSRRAAQALREESSAVNLAKDQLSENIRIQEEAIRQTQDQIAYWNLNRNYLVEQEAQLGQLQPLLEAQMQNLQEMRSQRLNLSSDVLLQTQTTQGQVEQASQASAADQDEVNSEIGALRAEINRLRSEQSRTRMSLTTLNTQITQAQKDARAKAQEVEALQNQIRLKQEELFSAPADQTAVE